MISSIKSMFEYLVETIKRTSFPWNAISICLVLCQYSTDAVSFHLQNWFLEKLLFLTSWNRVSQPRKYIVPICLFCPWVSSLHFTSLFYIGQIPPPTCEIRGSISHYRLLSAWFFLLLCSFFYVAEIYE